MQALIWPYSEEVGHDSRDLTVGSYHSEVKHVYTKHDSDRESALHRSHRSTTHMFAYKCAHAHTHTHSAMLNKPVQCTVCVYMTVIWKADTGLMRETHKGL